MTRAHLYGIGYKKEELKKELNASVDDKRKEEISRTLEELDIQERKAELVIEQEPDYD
jgi:hypothetical protein